MRLDWLWKDIRSHLVAVLLGALGIGGFATAFVTAIWQQLNRPITSTRVVSTILVFSVVCFLASAVSHRLRMGPPGNRTLLRVYLPILLSAVVLVWAYWIHEKVRLLEARMVRYVLPRTLTVAQKETISAHLRKFPPRRVVMRVIPRNQEARSYQADLQDAFEKGGWLVESVEGTALPIHPLPERGYHDEDRRPFYPEDMDNPENIPEGLNIEAISEPPPKDSFDRLKAKKPEDIIGEALGQARVMLDSVSTTEAENTRRPRLLIVIGNRRRDRFTLPYRGEWHDHFNEGPPIEDPDK